MAHEVTVEGSVTPCAGVLATGKRRTVAVTDDLRKYVKRGCVVVVEGSLDEPDEDPQVAVYEPQVNSIDEPDPEPVGVAIDRLATGLEMPPEQLHELRPPVAVSPPARNASRAEWAGFLDNHEPEPIDYPPGAGRDDLIDAYDDWQRRESGGVG